MIYSPQGEALSTSHRAVNMSFADTPIKSYVPWRPNRDFVKFFENMKMRRVSGGDGPTVRVTDTPVPVKQRDDQKQKSSTKNYKRTPSKKTQKRDGRYKGKESSKVDTSSSKRKGATRRRRIGKSAKILSSLEKKIRNHSF